MASWQKFLFLWLSQAFRFLSDYALRLFVVQETAQQLDRGAEAAWHTVVALFMAPSALLPPLYGVISNSYPKRWVLVCSAGYCLAVLVLSSGISQAVWWYLTIVLVALGSSLYSPTRHALLPAVAEETGWPLPRVMGLIEMGAILSMVVGMSLGSYLQPMQWEGWVNPAYLVVLAAALLSFLFAWPTHFQRDVVRPEPLSQAIRGFLRDLTQLCRQQTTCATMVGVALLRGLVTAAAGAFVADALTRSSGGVPPLNTLLAIALFSTVGMAIGSMLAGVITKASQPLRWVPVAATCLAAILLLGAGMEVKPTWLLLLAGMMGGLINVPLLSAFQAATPADARGNAMAILNSLGCLSMALISGLFAGLAWSGMLPPASQMWLVGIMTAGVAVLAWWKLT